MPSDLGETMSENAKGSLWKVSDVRIAVFFKEPADIREIAPAEWCGLVPDTDEMRIKENVRRQAGIGEDVAFEFIVMPLRVDCVWAHPECIPSAPRPNFPTGWEPQTALNIALGGIKPVLEKLPVFVRLGCVVTARAPSAGRQNSYELLGTRLPNVTIDSVGSSDFMYQVNRPRESKALPSMVVNRLSNWHATRVNLLALPQGVSFDERHAAEVTIDINTDSTQVEPIPLDVAASLLDELAALATEILEMGDVP